MQATRRGYVAIITSIDPGLTESHVTHVFRQNLFGWIFCVVVHQLITKYTEYKGMMLLIDSQMLFNVKYDVYPAD